MRDLVFVGLSVQEAVAAAADTLGRPAEALRYVVLDAGAPERGRTPAAPARIVVLAEDAAGEEPRTQARRGPPSPRVHPSAADRLDSIAAQLTRALGSAVTLSLSDTEDGRTLTVNAAGAGPDLWGEGGEVFRALEHLLKRIVTTLDGEQPPRIASPDYRSWRDARIHEQALSLAAEVAADRQARAFPRLNAYERRVVHMALTGRSDVATRSVGEGEQRELVIEPRHAE
jgi:spoIIIJ-associated protein